MNEIDAMRMECQLAYEIYFRFDFYLNLCILVIGLINVFNAFYKSFH